MAYLIPSIVQFTSTSSGLYSCAFANGFISSTIDNSKRSEIIDHPISTFAGGCFSGGITVLAASVVNEIFIPANFTSVGRPLLSGLLVGSSIIYVGRKIIPKLDSA